MKLLLLLSFRLALVIVAQIDGTQHSDSVRNEDLVYFQFSGPAFGLIRKYNQDQPLTKIDAQIAGLIDQNSNPIDAIVACGKSLGVPLVRTTVLSDRPRTIPTPSLIVLREIDDGEISLSVVLAESHTTNGLLIFDFRSGRGWNIIPYSVLEIQSNGEAIVRDSSAAWIPAAIGLICLLIAMWFIVESRKRKLPATRATAAASTVLAISLVTIVGCKIDGDATKIETTFLRSESRKIDLGSMADDEEKSFEVLIEATRDCTLSEVLTDCGCLVLEDNLAGHDLRTGQTKAIKLKLRTEGQVGIRQRFVRCTAKGPSGSSGSLDVFIEYQVLPKPKAEPRELEMTRFQGEESYKGHFVVWTRRLKTEPVTSVDIANSSWGGLLLKTQELESVSGSARVTGDFLDDRFHLELTAPITISPQPTAVVIALQPRQDRISVPVRFVARHPIDFSLNEVFLGFVKPQDYVTKRITCTNRALDEMGVASVAYQGAGEVKFGKRLSNLIPGENEFEFSLQPGQGSGRQTGSIKIEFTNPRIDAIQINLSWILP